MITDLTYKGLKKLGNLPLTEMLNLFRTEANNSVNCIYFASYLVNTCLKVRVWINFTKLFSNSKLMYRMNNTVTYQDKTIYPHTDNARAI